MSPRAALGLYTYCPMLRIGLRWMVTFPHLLMHMCTKWVRHTLLQHTWAWHGGSINIPQAKFLFAKVAKHPTHIEILNQALQHWSAATPKIPLKSWAFCDYSLTYISQSWVPVCHFCSLPNKEICLPLWNRGWRTGFWTFEGYSSLVYFQAEGRVNIHLTD